MPEKKPDDIMAEYLLKGAKMLSKTCPTCGSPMFTYKDRTFCVLCESETESGKAAGKKVQAQTGRPSTAGGRKTDVTAVPGTARLAGTGETSPLACVLEGTLITLAERIATEPDPDRCLSLMNTLKKGIEALTLLSQS
ncbi:MAG TPA: Sjogren's syndrome/scleroderma autoantigen 1 family protein [Methanoregulaceae archaeon]|nr:Sjogren's syndrome/scleroderma autoantigen 1 family protein [Methanoregulaceae archaeon]